MPDAIPPAPEPSRPTTPEPAPGGVPPSEDHARSTRYDANVRLIHRRLADEKRTGKSRKWWKGGA